MTKAALDRATAAMHKAAQVVLAHDHQVNLATVITRPDDHSPGQLYMAVVVAGHQSAADIVGALRAYADFATEYANGIEQGRDLPVAVVDTRGTIQ